MELAFGAAGIHKLTFCTGRLAFGKSSLQILLLIFCLLFCPACDCSEGDTSGAFGPRCNGDEMATESEDESNGGTGTILVSDSTVASFREFRGVSTLDSVVETDTPVTGGLTRMVSPGYLTLHPTTAELIVPDSGASAILFFSEPTSLEGNSPPDRVLSGAATELSGPVQVFVDPTNDELYVLDQQTSTVLVYGSAATIDGDTAPSRRINGGTTGIANPSAFIFRSSTEQLLVLNSAEILTFEGYRTANGSPAPSGRFGGAATTFGSLAFGQIDNSGSLVVVDSGRNQILTFENFEFDQANVAPTRAVSGGNVGLNSPGQFDFVGGTMYVTNGTDIRVFESLSTLDGNPFPDRIFSGLNPSTQGLRGLVFP